MRPLVVWIERFWLQEGRKKVLLHLGVACLLQALALRSHDGKLLEYALKLLARDRDLCSFLFDLLKLGASICCRLPTCFEESILRNVRIDGSSNKTRVAAFPDRRCEGDDAEECDGLEEGEIVERGRLSKARVEDGDSLSTDDATRLALDEAILEAGFFSDERCVGW